MWWRLSDVWIGGTIAALGAVVLLILIPFGVAAPEGLAATAVPPGFWPQTTAWMLLVFGAAVAVEGIWKRSSEAATAREPASSLAAGGLLYSALGFVFLYGAWAMIGWIGLPGTSVVLILGLGVLFGERRLWRLVCIAVLLPLALYYFFSAVADVPIPVGSLFE